LNSFLFLGYLSLSVKRFSEISMSFLNPKKQDI